VEILKSDLDTPRALIALRSIERDTSISGPTKGQLFAELDKIFGLDLTRPNEEITLTPEIFELLQLRGRAREVKDFALSDQLRDELLEQKIKVVDGPTGQTWEFIL
jgi:cysteinyl-tRNA synthetase